MMLDTLAPLSTHDRPFIEFIQSQVLDWVVDETLTGRRDVKVKPLSRDATTGATTMLQQFEAGWSPGGDEWCAADEELFVLSGSFSVNELTYRAHHYAYWPAGFARREFTVGEAGLVALVCTSGTPCYRAHAEAAPAVDPKTLTEQLDALSLRWDQTNMDPNIAHLNAYRKNLRLAPDGGGRTYLLAGLPQGYPASGNEPLERHPHVEEMFMIAGDMPCSLGTMRAGAYFWRPPGIWHGADCTLTGFLLFARTPGTNRTISEWSETPHAVSLTPPYAPRLPEALQPLARELADPIVY